jgi:hypothetical protein
MASSPSSQCCLFRRVGNPLRAGRAINAGGLVAGIRQTVTDIDPKQPVSNVRSLDEVLASETSAHRVGVWLWEDSPRLRWRNTDSVEHDVVADTPAFPEFVTTAGCAGRRASLHHEHDRQDENPLFDSPADDRDARRAGAVRLAVSPAAPPRSSRHRSSSSSSSRRKHALPQRHQPPARRSARAG